MCELDQLSAMGAVNRRQFTRMGVVLGAGATIAACSTTAAEAEGGLSERMVTFNAAGGTMDGLFVHPAGKKSPAVILWPDIAGLRPAKMAMGRRLAAEGFAVLVANPYYRSVAGQPFADFAAFRDGDGFNKVRPWMAANTPEAVMESAKSVAAWLDAQDAVDSSRGIGNQGYCMSGSWTIYSAAAVPSRIKAAASFHGGGLVGDAANTPVNLLDDLADDAKVLIAIAKNDDARAPADKDALRAAAAAAGADVEVEVYDGDHGWTVLDSPVYAEAAAERAFARLLALYRSTL
jgi:carboxymethylenebutenolidase